MNIRQLSKKQHECQLGEMTINIHFMSDGVFVILLKGNVSDDFSLRCEPKMKNFVQENFQGDVLFFIVSFADVEQVDLVASNQFFASLVEWKQLEAIYLIGMNDTFRLSVKLATAQNPFLPVYWAESINSALTALETPYRSPTDPAVQQSIFMQSKLNQRFYELWDTSKKIWVIGNQKYRVLSLSDWYWENKEGSCFIEISIIEDRIMHIKFWGELCYADLIEIRRVQERVFGELEMGREFFFNIFDISLIKVNIGKWISVFFRERKPLLLGNKYGIIGSKKLNKWVLKATQLLGRLERKPMQFFPSLADAFTVIDSLSPGRETSNLFAKSTVPIQAQIAEFELENEILQNNLEVGREKMFHIITQLNWQDIETKNLSPIDNILYKDIFRSLRLMREEFGKTWNMQQEKLWQLENSKEKALRAQLDPHFIFNSLNAIRHLLLEDEGERASELLNDFSDMMRLLLQTSLTDIVPLETEIDYLSLYVKMEMLRFEGRFDFDEQISPVVQNQMAELQIPPMLLQPYLEQAIWERVLPSGQHCNLRLHFDVVDEVLQCKISDNGLSFRQAQVRLHDFTKERAQRLKGLKSRLLLLEEMYACKVQIFQNEITTSKGKLQSEIVVQIPQACF